MFPNGKIEQLLDEDKVSNGVQGYNSTAINISYIGGIDDRGRATDNRTEAQKQSLIQLLERLKKKYPNAHIMGHRDIWGKNPKNWKKQCPCFYAEEEYKDIGKEQPKHKDTVVKNYHNPYIYEDERYLNKILDLRPWRD